MKQSQNLQDILRKKSFLSAINDIKDFTDICYYFIDFGGINYVFKRYSVFLSLTQLCEHNISNYKEIDYVSWGTLTRIELLTEFKKGKKNHYFGYFSSSTSKKEYVIRPFKALTEQLFHEYWSNYFNLTMWYRVVIKMIINENYLC
jgi:hypothetical protein